MDLPLNRRFKPYPKEVTYRLMHPEEFEHENCGCNCGCGSKKSSGGTSIIHARIDPSVRDDVGCSVKKRIKELQDLDKDLCGEK